MRKTAPFLLLLWIMLLQGCISEVKPILTKAEIDIPARISIQQRALDGRIADGSISSEAALKLQEELDKLKKRYTKLESEGKLKEKHIQAITKRLDANEREILGGVKSEGVNSEEQSVSPGRGRKRR